MPLFEFLQFLFVGLAGDFIADGLLNPGYFRLQGGDSLGRWGRWWQGFLDLFQLGIRSTNLNSWTTSTAFVTTGKGIAD